MSKIIEKHISEPWMTWVLIVLARQRKRQYWLKEMDALLKSADLKYDGFVPHHPEWQFNYHGMGLCLKGPNNERLDVNFHDGKAATIDPYFFTNRIFGLTIPEAPEERLKYWFPETELLILALRNLQGKYLEPKDSHVFRLQEGYEEDWLYFSDLVCTSPSDFKRLLHNIEGPEEQLTQHKANFEDWLTQQIQNKNLGPAGFEAIAKCLPETKRIAACSEKLQTVNHMMAAAVKGLDTVKDAPVAQVILLLDKLDPNIHHPYLAYTVCQFLLKRNLEQERCISILIAFSEIRKVTNYKGNPYDYNLAHLVLIYSPKSGIPLLRRALRSSTPNSVHSASALMALIDTDWSNNELVKVLEEGVSEENKTNKRYIIAALLHSTNNAFREIGKLNAIGPSPRTENAVGWTRDQVIEASMGHLFQSKLERTRGDLDVLDLEKIRLAIE